MDQQTRLDGATTPATAMPTLTRRGFLRWARNGVLAAAGLSLASGSVLAALAPGGADAKESDDEDKDEKSSKSKKKKAESKQSDADKSNKKKNKKKNKAKNKEQKAITASPYGKYIVPGQDKFNCTDFTSQAEAQGTLRLVPSDPNNLDRNRDGIACGGTEAFQDGVPGGFMMPPYDINPVPRP